MGIAPLGRSLFREEKGKVLPGQIQEPGSGSELWEGRGLPSGIGINSPKNPGAASTGFPWGKEDFLMGYTP